ncbi:hypothetical protein CSV63_15730 [Sporosarcina sp. P34]|uniref:hypothetical protein n=1 Tax=Sporosarcina sp. P34 TaxID=2048247 RepID=UPI000C16D48C|nr:hypothetical protein [Sporosarcina sp. P34]PID13873.1 hypothetical protein CSV63_15730 [Sporosarcina sp. P34]
MNDLVLISLLVLLVIRNFIKDKETWREIKKLHTSQLIGVTINFILTVLAITTLIFYGGNWLAAKFSNFFLQSFSFIVIVFLVLSCIGTLSDKAMNKITNGALPKK